MQQNNIYQHSICKASSTLWGLCQTAIGWILEQRFYISYKYIVTRNRAMFHFCTNSIWLITCQYLQNTDWTSFDHSVDDVFKYIVFNEIIRIWFEFEPSWTMHIIDARFRHRAWVSQRYANIFHAMAQCHQAQANICINVDKEYIHTIFLSWYHEIN